MTSIMTQLKLTHVMDITIMQTRQEIHTNV